MERTLGAYRTLGSRLSFSCTPYLFDNIPRQKEVIAFSESSATDSPKCGYYTKRRNMSFVVRDLKDCVLAALEGSIE